MCYLQTLRYDEYMQPHRSRVLAIKSAVWGLQLISGHIGSVLVAAPRKLQLHLLRATLKVDRSPGLLCTVALQTLLSCDALKHSRNFPYRLSFIFFQDPGQKSCCKPCGHHCSYPCCSADVPSLMFTISGVHQYIAHLQGVHLVCTLGAAYHNIRWLPAGLRDRCSRSRSHWKSGSSRPESFHHTQSWPARAVCLGQCPTISFDTSQLRSGRGYLSSAQGCGSAHTFGLVGSEDPSLCSTLPSLRGSGTQAAATRLHSPALLQLCAGVQLSLVQLS